MTCPVAKFDLFHFYNEFLFYKFSFIFYNLYLYSIVFNFYCMFYLYCVNSICIVEFYTFELGNFNFYCSIYVF